MSNKRKSTDLEMTEELFEFLQGRLPKLTPDQAWVVIWYLGELYWQVTDHIERCGVCGNLFDINNSGDCLDFGKAPYQFCDNCRDGEEYEQKSESRLNPEKKVH